MEYFRHWVSRLKSLSKRLNYSSFFISLGFLLIVFGGINYYRARILSFRNAPPKVAESQLSAETPTKIIIPSLKIDLAVEVSGIKDGVWQISYQNASFLDTSARPGTGGNVVIYGHNKKVIFGSLPYLSLGQKIVIETKNGKMFVYKAVSKETVSPDRVELLYPSEKEELTLFTCTGLFDLQRVIIKAIPI